MKKLVLVALALGLAINLEAASANWKLTGDATTENYTVYLVGALSSSWTSVADLATAAKAYAGEDGSGYTGTITAKGGRGGVYTYIANGTLTSDKISKDSASVYFVLVKDSTATSYTYKQMDLASYVYEGTESSTATFSAATSDLTESGTFATGGGDDPSGVPEPTSAMLVLVGLAGLALKRKQA